MPQNLKSLFDYGLSRETFRLLSFRDFWREGRECSKSISKLTPYLTKNRRTFLLELFSQSDFVKQTSFRKLKTF